MKKLMTALVVMLVGCTAATPGPGSAVSSTPSAPTVSSGSAPDAGGPCAPLASKAPATANPASTYCVTLGYKNTGGQCAFPDGTSCEEFAFYRGACGGAHSFCNLHGGTISNKTENKGSWQASYGLCTMPSGATCAEDAFMQSCRCGGS